MAPGIPILITGFMAGEVSPKNPDMAVKRQITEPDRNLTPFVQLVANHITDFQ
jgi:hypothetical protein